jgi:hypothetical protein
MERCINSLAHIGFMLNKRRSAARNEESRKLEQQVMYCTGKAAGTSTSRQTSAPRLFLHKNGMGRKANFAISERPGAQTQEDKCIRRKSEEKK